MPLGRGLRSILSLHMNGCPDARIRAAPADIAAQGVVDVGIAGSRCFLEQRARRHQLSALAISALHDVDLGPCPTQCIDLTALDPFDGRDLATPNTVLPLILSVVMAFLADDC